MPRKKAAPRRSSKNAFNTVTTFSKILAFILFITLPFVGFYLGLTFQKNIDESYLEGTAPNINSFIPQKKACTMEAKVCPDGSYVARTGPDCTFAKCPGEK